MEGAIDDALSEKMLAEPCMMPRLLRLGDDGSLEIVNRPVMELPGLCGQPKSDP